MKKGLLLVLCFMLLFSAAACQQQDAVSDEPAAISFRLSDADLPAGATAADLIIAVCQAQGIPYTFNDGMFDNFNGVASTDSAGWLLYVDGELAELGANDIVVESEDTVVEFRYISYQEAFPEYY